ncbi:alpha/beta hydrolase [Anseongella ginsenosidimutans]|nr:alpha/beta hydrolase [Anseongella ginsenosidimutans]
MALKQQLGQPAQSVRALKQQPGRKEKPVQAQKQRRLFKAFRFWRMFAGPLSKKVRFQTMCYYDSRGDASHESNPGCYLELDFYPSQAGGLSPCIIVIHGGSWSSGHSRQLPELNSRLAGSGYHVAAINYRLAPQYQSPLAVEDVQNAMAFLRKHAGELKIAPDRFVLLGRSAGGQIALQAAYALCDPGIRGVVAYYAPADMVWGYSAPASRLIMDSCKVMEAYLGGSYSAVPENYHSASPLEALAENAPPTLLLHGKNDVLVAYEHSVRLALALRAAGTRHYLLSLPGGTHGFDYVLDGPEGQLATYAVRYFLKVILAPQ